MAQECRLLAAAGAPFFLHFGTLSFVQVFKTGNLYHLVHSAALLACPLMKRPNLVRTVLCLLLLPSAYCWRVYAHQLSARSG